MNDNVKINVECCFNTPRDQVLKYLYYKIEECFINEKKSHVWSSYKMIKSENFMKDNYGQEIKEFPC